jgi:lipopolysaccharide export system protein LptA
MRRFSVRLLLLPVVLATSIGLGSPGNRNAIAQQAPAQPLTLKANTTEANAKTGVVVAKGNVQINYPARQIQATAAQAVYYSKERRIELSGDVYVLQQGNSLRGEVIIYLVDEGRFVAKPQANRQVEAIYLIQDTPAAPGSSAQSPFGTKSEFSTPAKSSQ